MSTRSTAQTLLIVVTMTLGVAFMLILLTGSIRNHRMAGNAMAPGLPKGCNVIVVRWPWAHRGDIVTFRHPQHPEFTMIERVVGVGGDMLEMREKRLKVNGKEAVEPYVIHEDDAVYPNNAPDEYRIRDNFGPLRVPEGKLFVLGDNRDNSSDSRYWGPIASDSVKGRPVLAISPERGVWRP